MSNTQKTTKRKVKNNTVTVEKIINQPQRMVYKVPHCAEHYFDTLIDPFNAETGACVPADLFPMPSQKVKVWSRGTFQVGANGFGFIIVGPSGDNETDLIRYTQPSSAGVPSVPFSSFTNLLTQPISSLPYNQADLESKRIQWRLVSLGLRVKYVGKLMDQQGVVYAIEEPDHNSVLAHNFVELVNLQYVRVDRVGQMKDWDSTVSYSGPVTPEELEYTTTNELYQQFMGCVVSGGAGDNYEFEVCEHLEYIGTKAPGRTPSHADAHAFGKVVEVTKNASASQPLQPSMGRPLWDRFKTAVTDGLPKLISGTVQVVSSAFNGDLSKMISGSRDLYQGVQPSVRALMETPASRGHQVHLSSPYLALPPPRLIIK